jgi:2-aminoadipate transaminase
VRGLLRARRDAMLGALEEGLGGSGAEWSRPEGGYFVWLELPGDLRAKELLARAEERGVTFVPGTDFYPAGAAGEAAARLAYSFVSPAEVEEGVARLAELVASAAPYVAARASGRGTSGG